MKNIKLLINISSYLLKKSVLSLLYENFSFLEVVTIDKHEENYLLDVLLKEKPAIIITEVPIMDNLIKDVYVIGINIKSSDETGLNDVFHISDTQSTLIHKIQSGLNRVKRISKIGSETQELSDREKDILKAVAHGLTNQEIADKLFLSIHTVTTHRKNITAKLGIKTISGLTLYALLNGLVNLEETKLI